VKYFVGCLGALALAACAPAPRAPVDSLESLAAGEVMLVGRVELVPALRKGEQKIRGVVVPDMENRMFLMADTRLRELPRDPAIADYAGRIEALMGTTFFVRSRAEPFYLLGGLVFLDIGGASQQRAYFPGGFKVTPLAGQQAVYIGTLRYQRDEFFEITRVTVVDDYAQASAEFAKRFGSRQSLRKALMTRAGP
jgi:hypothetical protein